MFQVSVREVCCEAGIGRVLDTGKKLGAMGLRGL
jgi:hypothetical protein